jgi:hypothetical protein
MSSRLVFAYHISLVQRDAPIDEIRSVITTDYANGAMIRLSGTNQLELSLLCC